MHLRNNFLDASAAVRILLKEPGYEAVRDYFRSESQFRITPMSVAETFGVLKRKFNNEEITAEEYFDAAGHFAFLLRDSIQTEEASLTSGDTVFDCEKLSRKHDIDLADALQLVAILDGPTKMFVGKSASILITADRKLAKAARAEGIRVWNCAKEQPPLQDG